MLRLRSRSHSIRPTRSPAPKESFAFYRALSRQRHRGESGITLVEVLVSIALLGLLLGPLAASMLVMVRGGATVKETMTRSAEAQKIGEAWTHDVQSVDADGVNEPVGETCGDPAANEVELVTFGWDRASNSGGAEKLVTWVARGFGENVTLLRRYCEGTDGTDPLQVNGDGQVLAEDFGVVGMPVSQLISGGPAATPGAEYCTTDADGVKRTCTISINGDFTYDLTVKRRVPDVRGADILQVKPPPLPVTNIIGHPRWQYLFVDWMPQAQPSGQSPVTDYRVYLYSDAAGSAQVGNPVDVEASASLLRATFDGLANDMPYFVRIRSKNAVGWSDYSDVYGPMVPTGSIPDPATNVVATANPGAGTVDVTWDSAANSGGQPRTGYSVWGFLDETPDVESDVPATLIGPITHQYTPTELSDQPSSTTMTFNLPLEDFGQYRFVVADNNATGASWFPGDTVNLPAVSNIASPFTSGSTIFASPSGGDSGSCGTPASPCRSLLVALANADTTGATTVGLAAGTYGRGSIDASNASGGLKIVGSLSADFSTSGAGTTTIRGGAAPGGAGRSAWSGIDIVGTTAKVQLADLSVSGAAGSSNAGASATSAGIDVSSASGGVEMRKVSVDGGAGRDVTGLQVRNSSSVTVVDSSIESGDPLGSGQSAYGVRALSSSTVLLSETSVTAAAGRAGSNGTDGVSPSHGCNGKNGIEEGSGSVVQCGSASARGGSGGGAGNGSDSGSDGGTGRDSGNGTNGGDGGDGGGGSSCIGGNRGDNGSQGSGGSAGSSAGAPTGAVPGNLGERWVGTSGSSGGDGAGGRGGGGGGGGSGYRKWGWFCNGSRYRGGSGGEGGGGGTGGSGGVGGQAGGGSFGVFANDATVTLVDCTVAASDGGSGGAGGKGGRGAAGGNGGNGGDEGDAYGGGGGAGGGAGGGGAGGSGGEGGPSVGAIWVGTGSVNFQGTTAIQRAETASSGGAGGSFGAGGSGGIGGRQNVSGTKAADGGNGATKTGTSPAGPDGRLCATIDSAGTCTA